MAELGKLMVEERIAAAQGGPEFRRYIALEYGKHAPPPTPIPARWLRKGYKARAKARRAVARITAALLRNEV